MKDIHRGRSKKDKKIISIHLTPDEWNQLKAIADSQCRSASGQAVWFIKKALGGSNE